MSATETLERLKREYPWFGIDFLEQIASNQEHAAWYAGRLAELVDLANDKDRAQELWGRHCGGGDWEPRLERMKRLMLANKLGPRDEIMAVETIYVSPEAKARREAAEAEAGRLHGELDAILARVLDPNRARLIYGLIGGFLDDEKIATFKARLQAEGLLP